MNAYKFIQVKDMNMARPVAYRLGLEPDLHFNRLITGQLAWTPGCDSVSGLAQSSRQPSASRRQTAGCAGHYPGMSEEFSPNPPLPCLVLVVGGTSKGTHDCVDKGVKLKTDHPGLLAGVIFRSGIAHNIVLTWQYFLFLFALSMSSCQRGFFRERGERAGGAWI